MADIYVDPTSLTNGTGSIGNPRNIWPTGIGAGDRILLKRGTRLVSATQLGLGAGSDNTVTAYGPTTDPLPIITITSGNQALFFVDRPGVSKFEYIHFDSCLNMGANGGAIGTGPVAAARHANLHISHCKFTNIGVNGILINSTNTANAPTTFICEHTTFDLIGADCVYGPALNYVFANNRCTRMSSNGTNGDGVGFISADPDFVWIHHNYIDHSLTDSKQCIIIDSTTPGVGQVIIENNVLIGFGSSTVPAEVHTVIISDPNTIIRNNIIYSYGLTCGVNTANDRITNNVFIVGNLGTIDQPVSISGDGIIANNTFICTKQLNTGKRAIAMGGSATSAAAIQNNVFVNWPTALQSNVVPNPTMGGNSYWNVIVPRNGSGGPFSEPTEVITNPLLENNYMPKSLSPLLNGGINLGWQRDINGIINKNYIGAYSTTGVAAERGVR